MDPGTLDTGPMDPGYSTLPPSSYEEIEMEVESEPPSSPDPIGEPSASYRLPSASLPRFTATATAPAIPTTASTTATTTTPATTTTTATPIRLFNKHNTTRPTSLTNNRPTLF